MSRAKMLLYSSTWYSSAMVGEMLLVVAALNVLSAAALEVAYSVITRQYNKQ